jgi:FkbM family methyltransferase
MNKNIFNNCDSMTNGEYNYYKYLVKEKNIKIIFDVGSRNQSIFLDFNGEVHYFEPVKLFINELKNKFNNNSKSIFNNFGLGNENKSINYYPKYESFYDRINSCNISDEKNKIKLSIKKGDDYLQEIKSLHNITEIDFFKIDTEGFELEVLKGLKNSLPIIKYIQFEYGGTFLYNGIKLVDIINFLKENNFEDFRYLTPYGSELIIDLTDHYQYCNIVCKNSNKVKI